MREPDCCNGVACGNCGPGLRGPGDLARFDVQIADGVSWGDVAACTVTIRLRPRGEAAEFLLPVRVGGIFAATRAGLVPRQPPARPVGILEGKVAYGSSREGGMLLGRRGPGAFDLRLFVPAQGAVVRVRGYRLADPPPDPLPRFYRTGDRILAVLPGSPLRGRDLRWLDAADRPGGVEQARDVPWVGALETAVSGRGASAAGYDALLVFAGRRDPVP